MLKDYGFINDADYTLTKTEIVNGKRVQTWVCPFYKKWKDMAVRCYTKSSRGRIRDYSGVEVSEDWKTFSNFKSWMESKNWEGKVLDKDIIGNGKLYSEETCCLVDVKVNNFILDKKNKRSGLTGSVYDKRRDKYQVHCKNPETGKYEGLGRYDTELEGHIVWLYHKTSHLNNFILPLIEDEQVIISIKLYFKNMFEDCMELLENSDLPEEGSIDNMLKVLKENY